MCGENNLRFTDRRNHIGSRFAGNGRQRLFQYRITTAAQQLGKAIDQGFGYIGQRGINEGGTAALAGVSVQGELRNDDCFPFYIQH